MERRNFVTTGAAIVGAGLLAVSKGARAEEKKAGMVAACGLSCDACALLKAGKCKGCATGMEASEEKLKMKSCAVLSCAAMKKIDYCGTGCKMAMDCQKLIGRPYAESFIAGLKKRMQA
jgi:hypothetical protein